MKNILVKIQSTINRFKESTLEDWKWIIRETALVFSFAGCVVVLIISFS